MKTKQTILIVDDVKENVDVLIELLKEYDLVTALDGETALKIVEDEEIDLILLDIMMPKMNGFEVCKILKLQDATSHIPIIFLSAKNKHEDIQQGFKLGAVDYVAKPFNPNELLSRVDTHLKLRMYEKNLEKRVTQELEKNKLKEQMIYQQSKQAALGELLMHIAHQWKQPLASLGSIHLLQRTKIEQNIKITTDELLSMIEKAENLISFMSTTVDTFKNFYQPSYDDKYFSITNAVHNVFNISEATLNYDNIKTTITSNETENTFGNENEFTQIIFSILNNAREIFKQRDIQNPEIKIDIQNQKISISDNAGGIDKDIISDIFLPFTSTTNSNGIGLYIAKEMSEKNSAVISVTNDEDGAVFKIEFLTWLN